jgi:hypothetical protein
MNTSGLTLLEKSNALAAIIGCHPGTIYRAIKPREDMTKPAECGAPLAAAIHHASNGEFAAWEIRPDIWVVGQVPPRPNHVSSSIDRRASERRAS